MNNQIIKSLIFQYFLGGIYLLATGLLGNEAILSALAGCIAGLVPNTYFSLRMLRQPENYSAAQWLGYAYRSEFGKWLIMGAIFVFVFNTDHSWDPIVLFAGFSLILISGWFVPFIIKSN